MNVPILNRKLNAIIEANNLRIKEPIQNLIGSKLGVSEAYLFQFVLPPIQIGFGVCYQELVRRLKAFKSLFDQVELLIVLSGSLNLFDVFFQNIDYMEIYDKLYQSQAKQENNEHLKLKNVAKQFYTNDILIQAFQDVGLAYVISPSSSEAQLRYLFQIYFINAILSPLQILQYFQGLKSLNYLIVYVEKDFYHWMDVKQFTAKIQLSFDAIGDLYLLYEFASGVQRNTIFTQQALDAYCNQNRGKSYEELPDDDKMNINFLFVHQILQGKIATFESKLNKAKAQIDQNLYSKFLPFYQFYKHTPILNQLSTFIFPFQPQPDLNNMFQRYGPQLPQEIWILESFGIGKYFHQHFLDKNLDKQLIAPSEEYVQLDLEDLQTKAFNLVLTYMKPQFQSYSNDFKKTDLKKVQFSDSSINLFETLQNYKKHMKNNKVNSKNNQKANTSQVNKKTINNFINCQILHNLGLIDLENHQSYCDPLKKVKQENFEQSALILYLILKGQSRIFTDFFETQFNTSIRNFENQEVFHSVWPNSSENMVNISLISRILSLQSQECQFNEDHTLSLYDYEMSQFICLINQIYQTIQEMYESTLIAYFFDLKNQTLLKEFTACSQLVPFRKKANSLYGTCLILSLTERMNSEQIEKIIPNFRKQVERGFSLLSDVVEMMDSLDSSDKDQNQIIFDQFRNTKVYLGRKLNLKEI